MGRLLGLDYGDIHIGVAISDPLGSFSLPLTTIVKKDKNTIKPAVKEIGELIKAYDITKIIVGYPKNMDDTLGDRAHITQEFKERLERNFKKIEIKLWDERLTTQMAREILAEQNIHGKAQKEVLDQVSASIILQDYMDYTQRR